jgi:GAF domain-containing protein
VDAAAISFVFGGVASATLGVSEPRARAYDELQFTMGEGPCLDSVSSRAPVLVTDLAHPEEMRWPAYGPAMLAHKIRGVYAMPVLMAGGYLGALDLFSYRPDTLDTDQLAGA